MLRSFRYQHEFGTRGNSASQGDKSRITAHDFHKEQAVVGGSCITYPIDGFNGRVDRRIITNAVVCSGEVIVDRTGSAYGRKPEFVAEGQGTCKSTVPADGDQAFDTVIDQLLIGLLSTLK